MSGVETRAKAGAASVGAAAPDFTLKDGEGNDWRLSEQRGRVVVLLFYPGDETPVCTKQMCSVRDNWEEYQRTGAEVVGVSTDSVHSHRAWLKTPRDKGGVEGLRYPLASDITKSVARDYGVLIEDKGVALRGLFVIDPEGTLRYAVIHDLNVGRSADETLRVIQALQTGGLCQADWRPGQETLKVG